MVFRFIFLIFFSISIFSVTASAINSEPSSDATLVDAAAKLLKKDYRGAIDSAIRAPESGKRDFFIGMILERMGEWDNSAWYLGKASGTFSLLADYAMLNQAQAFSRLSKFSDALSILQLMFKTYPYTPLIRSAMKLRADVLYDGGDFRSALGAYQEFIERYRSGTDYLDSLYRISQCRERMGEIETAIIALREIWLKYPASSAANNAEKGLKRLADSGAKLPPFTPEEMIERGTVLYDLGRYESAEATLSAVPQGNLERDLKYRLMMKIGQSRYKARKYKNAEETFKALLSKDLGGGVQDEAIFWLAKTMERSGREDEAFAAYMGLAESSSGSPLADDSLLAAYFIKKFQNKGGNHLNLLRRLESEYPRSALLPSVYWEIAWQSYEKGDFKTAAAYFKKVLKDKSRRETGLYWYSRTLAAAGDKKETEKTLALLAAEYPFGFYALTLSENSPVWMKGVSSGDHNWTIPPESSDFERAKTLIKLGLYEEAGKELAWLKRRDTNDNDALSIIARLYLKIGDFHSSSACIKNEGLRNMNMNNIAEWEMAYPLAYREHVTSNTAESGIAEEVIYSIMRAESNYSSTAVSPSGAVGLMQIMPTTALAFKTPGNGEIYEIKERLKNPEINIHLGVKHFKDMLVLYNGDIVYSVAAYNAGSGNVNRWLKTSGGISKDLFIEKIPFSETREYVKKVLAGIEIYKRIYHSGTSTIPETQIDTPSPKVIPPVSSPVIFNKE